MKKTFVVSSDDVVNSYGFRVLTSGIDTKLFEKNPIGLFNHNRDNFFTNDYTGPIVQWSNLQFLKEGLHADAEFDTEDPKGKLIANKVEKGFLRGASIGFRIIETSEDPKLMLPGQKYPTVTKCELREISIVDIPSNPNAVALFDEAGNRIELKEEEELMAHLSAFNPATQSQIHNMKKLSITAALTALAAFFGLESGKDHEVEPTPEQLATLNNQLAENATLKTDVQRLTNELNAANTKASGLETQLADLNTKITEKDAEIKRLGDLAVGANGAGGSGAAANNAGAEGAGANNKLSFETPEDRELKALMEVSK